MATATPTPPTAETQRDVLQTTITGATPVTQGARKGGAGNKAEQGIVSDTRVQ